MSATRPFLIIFVFLGLLGWFGEAQARPTPGQFGAIAGVNWNPEQAKSIYCFSDVSVPTMTVSFPQGQYVSTLTRSASIQEQYVWYGDSTTAVTTLTLDVRAAGSAVYGQWGGTGTGGGSIILGLWVNTAGAWKRLEERGNGGSGRQGGSGLNVGLTHKIEVRHGKPFGVFLVLTSAIYTRPTSTTNPIQCKLDSRAYFAGMTAASKGAIIRLHAGHPQTGTVTDLGGSNLTSRALRIGLFVTGDVGGSSNGDVFIGTCNGVPGVPALLIFGHSKLNIPWRGGIGVPTMDYTLLFTTNLNGVNIWRIPGYAVPKGLYLNLQVWALDISPYVVSASNAVNISG